MSWLDAFPLVPASRTAAAGELLLARSAEPAEALFLRSGQVAAGLQLRGALRHRVLAVEQPGWLDVGTVLLRESAFCDWVAETPVQLWCFDAQALRDWHATQPAAAGMLVHDLARAQRHQAEAMLALLMQGTEARCAQWLLQHAHSAADGRVAIELQQRKRTIAAHLGMAPETFSRALRQLRERGLIRQDGMRLHLTDVDGLQQVATG
jgi:CRP-like cAMP-binding protein